MAVNRFWGNAQPAQYSELSSADIYMAPSLMYQREEDAKAKIDAMNEAAVSLKSMLGDKAPITEEFDSQYKSILESMAKEGATRNNLEKLRTLKSTYVKEYLPIQDFAKNRELWGTEYNKAKIDNNNIVIGDHPLNKSFDEYRKNPSSLQFNVVKKDDLIKQGMFVGKEWAKSTSNPYTDEYGRIIDQEGFRTADEALNAYNTDDKFKGWVEAQIDTQAASTGAADNPEVRNALRSGILTSVVGEKKASPDRMAELGLRGGKSDPMSQGRYVDILPVAAPTDKPWEPILANKEVRASMSKAIEQTSKGKYKSLDEIDDRLRVLEKKAGSDSSNAESFVKTGLTMGTAGFNANRTGSISQDEFNEMKKLKEYKKLAEEAVKSEPEYNTHWEVIPSSTAIGSLPATARGVVEKTIEGLSLDADVRLGTFVNEDQARYGGATAEDRKAIEEYVKSGDRNKRMKFIGLSVQRDPFAKVGTGAPFLVFEMQYGTDKKDKNKPSPRVSISMPKDMTDKAVGVLKFLGSGDPYTSSALEDVSSSIKYYQENVEDPYYNQETSEE